LKNTTRISDDILTHAAQDAAQDVAGDMANTFANEDENRSTSGKISIVF
jgi:hypothetical protein